VIRVEGEVAKPTTFDFAALAALPQQVADVGSMVPGKQGGAVRLRALLEAAGAKPSAQFATLEGDGGKFAVSVPLAAVADNAVVAYRLGDAALPDKQGGPARFYILDVKSCGDASGVDACANVKRLSRIKLTREREPDVGHWHEGS